MSRVYNFSAGPAALPIEVLERIRADIPDWNGTGMTVMEVSHRGKAFMETAAKAERDVRELLAVPDDYGVLFIQGGATMQFSMVPLNLAAASQTVDYVQTGSWSKKAIAEARRYCTVNLAADSADQPAHREARDVHEESEVAHVNYQRGIRWRFRHRQLRLKEGIHLHVLAVAFGVGGIAFGVGDVFGGFLQRMGV